MTIKMLRVFEVLSVGMALLGSSVAENAASGSDPSTQGTAHHQILQRAQGSTIQLVPSSQLSATTSRRVSSEELDGMEQALERYQAVFENLSLMQLRQVWPTLDRRREAAFKEVFEVFRETSWTHKLELTCATPMIGVETTTVECEETLAYGDTNSKPKEVGPDRVAIVLRRQSSNWVVEDMKGW
jgi:hypothetical protein